MIMDGCQGKPDMPVVRKKAFQLMVEEDRAVPDVVMGMYLLLIYLFMLIFLLISVCFVLGSFLVNRISALVLFDSGATRSFVSLAFNKRFVDALKELDCPLEVEIVDDRHV